MWVKSVKVVMWTIILIFINPLLSSPNLWLKVPSLDWRAIYCIIAPVLIKSYETYLINVHSLRWLECYECCYEWDFAENVVLAGVEAIQHDFIILLAKFQRLLRYDATLIIQTMKFHKLIFSMAKIKRLIMRK